MTAFPAAVCVPIFMCFGTMQPMRTQQAVCQDTLFRVDLVGEAGYAQMDRGNPRQAGIIRLKNGDLYTYFRPDQIFGNDGG